MTPIRSKKGLRGDVGYNVKIFSPSAEILTIKGKLFYHEGSQAWSMMRLKKEVIKRYPHLKEKRGNFIYFLKVPETFTELKEEIESLEKTGNALPLILLLGKEKVDST